jgi:hypothetical protein
MKSLAFVQVTGLRCDTDRSLFPHQQEYILSHMLAPFCITNGSSGWPPCLRCDAHASPPPSRELPLCE